MLRFFTVFLMTNSDYGFLIFFLVVILIVLILYLRGDITLNGEQAAYRRIKQRKIEREAEGGYIGIAATVVSQMSPEQRSNLWHGLLTWFGSKEKIADAAVNAQNLNIASNARQATKAGVSLQTHDQLQRDRIKSQIEIDERRSITRDVIEAGQEVNASVFKRKQKILDEIRQIEARLSESTVSPRERKLLKKDLDTLEAEYERLRQDSV